MTHAAHEAMNLKWFKTLGLYNLAEHYVKYFKETAQYDQRTLGGVRGRQG
jgi:hypothetical protein